MRPRFPVVMIGLSIAALLCTAVPRDAAAQPVASYTPPRTPDGQPDLQGIWQVMNTAAWDIQDHAASLGVPAGAGVVSGGEIPYQPWAAKQKADNYANRRTLDPETKCHMPGVPRITYMPYPFQIAQGKGQTLFLYEYIHVVRPVFTNGNPHPKGPIDWLYMGDSRGRWEDNTLVVDTIHFRPVGDTWLDRAGNFTSEELHVVERYTPTGPDHMRYDVTLEDPKVFTRPWTMSMVLYRRKEPNVQLLEYECYGYQHYEGGSR
jgi:hypothetical protein